MFLIKADCSRHLRLKSLLGCALAALLTAFSPAAASAQMPNLSTTNAAKWGSHIDIEGKWGNRRSLGDIGLFAPLWQNQNSLFFADIRARYDNDEGREGNFGFGFRQMLANGWNAGFYGFYDVRKTPNDSYFRQATLGLELLHHDFDARTNFYIPFGDRERVIGGGGGGTPFADIQGGNLVIVTPGGQLVERALRGADFELGYRLPVFPWNSMVQLRAYAGGFWFDGENLISDISGPRGRLELSWDNLPYLNEGSRFTIGLEAQHDDVRGSNNFVMTRLRIPLSAEKTRYASLTPQERRMTERVVRDVDIVAPTVQKGGGTPTTEAAINEHNNVQVTSYAQVDAGTATTVDLLDAMTIPPSGAVVVANGTFIATGSLTFDPGNTLLGGGAVLPLRGAISGVQVNFTAPGAAGSINGNLANTFVVTLRSDSVLGGMTIGNTNPTAGSALSASNTSNVTVFGNTLSADANTGTFYAQNTTGLKVLNNTITGSANTAVVSYGLWLVSSSSALIEGNNITASSGGILLNGLSDSIVRSNTARTTGTVAGDVSLAIANSTNITVQQNSLDGGVLSDFLVSLQDSSIAAGSTGNIDLSNGAVPRCVLNGVNTGTVTFTSGPSCP